MSRKLHIFCQPDLSKFDQPGDSASQMLVNKHLAFTISVLTFIQIQTSIQDIQAEMVNLVNGCEM